MKKILFSLPLLLSVFLVACNSDSSKSHTAAEESQYVGNTGKNSSFPASEEVAKPLSDDERIKQIKAWYNQIQEKAKTEGMVANCSNAKWQTTDQVETFDQKAKRCSFTDNFEIVQSEFEGWEWGEKCTHYFKKGKIFFVLYEGNSIANTTTYRGYYNEQGVIFKIIEDVDDFINDKKSRNEITSASEINRIKSYFENNYSKSISRLK